MSTPFYADCGNTFRVIRQNRCLTISDIRGNLSSSTVSRFENGKSDISISNLFDLCDRLQMDLSEFFCVLQNLDEFNHPSWDESKFTQTVINLHAHRDLIGLRSLMQNQERLFKTTKNSGYHLRCALLKAVIIDNLDSFELLSPADSSLITGFLLSHAHWYEFEYHLLIDTIPFLQEDDQLSIYNKLLLTHFSVSSHDTHIKLFAEALYNVAVTFAYKNHFIECEHILSLIPYQSLSVNALFLRYRIQELSLISYIKISSDVSAKEKLRLLQESMEILSPQIAKNDTDFIKRLNITIDSN